MSLTPGPAWIDASNPADEESRKIVRAHAARVSAAARRATMLKKASGKAKQPGTNVFAIVPAERAVKGQRGRQVVKRSAPGQQAAGVDGHDQFPSLVHVISTILDRCPILRGETSLAHGSFRNMLWDAFTVNTTLWHVALFIAGTHSNTCGLPHSVLAHLGAGLVVLRGASLDAIQQKMDATDETTPIGVALLAGWEKRFGDVQAYEIHMQAWKAMTIPGMSLDERNVTTLTQLTMDMYRSELDDKATALPSDRSPYVQGILTTLPLGYRMISLERAETRSLMVLTARFAQFDPTSKGEVARLRKIGLENLAWGASHTHGGEPDLAYEADYDPLALCALYHVRAANISIVGVMLERTMRLQGLVWNFDLRGSLYTHTASCVHLGTERLCNTQYQWIGLWARYSLCAIAPDPSQDAFIIDLLESLGILSWGRMRAMLEDHLYFDEPHFHDYKRYWEKLTVLSNGVLHDGGPSTLATRVQAVR
jgi:hypothetical protein